VAARLGILKGGEAKMKEQAFANAFAVTIAIVYVVCAGWVVVSRSTFMGLAGSWIHGVNMESLPYTAPTAAGLVFGLITAVVASWVAGYIFAWLYKQFSKM